MTLIVLAAITLLIVTALFHIYWAFGGEAGLNRALPTKDGKRLLNPGRLLTFAVALLLFGCAFVAYALYVDASPAKPLLTAGWVLSILFILRAVGDFNAVGFFKKINATDFAAYDTQYFSPLCLSLGMLFALLSSRA
ncbi:DUF3995 domain-containing protein [Sulfurimonas sp. HSL-3221]|uniref:DUF3995 domain-containing protein n=1 Tax=Thiomicrolovo sulfuroxydans TaxID=2894755 RepID=UPI001E5DC6B5|nr:DUF3995 domain-containing protein [Sulfurimonas sp. HSL-3221]UFS63485.1 DUF3995 domain-containing protein [Sulfurimonas sp. HSL-3221]